MVEVVIVRVANQVASNIYVGFFFFMTFECGFAILTIDEGSHDDEYDDYTGVAGSTSC
jgi:hypothetical protein